MGKSKYVITHHEIVESMFELKHGRPYVNQTDDNLWNKICNSMDNDAHGDYSIDDINEGLDDDQDSLFYKGLMKILIESKKKSLMIVRE